MVTLQSLLEIILPCLVQSEKVHEQSRALGAISRLLRLTCNFPELSCPLPAAHGRVLDERAAHGHPRPLLHEPQPGDQHGGLRGPALPVQNPRLHRGERAGRVPFSLLRPCPELLVLGRRYEHETEDILKDLQKHFRAEWFANIQDLTMECPRGSRPQASLAFSPSRSLPFATDQRRAPRAGRPPLEAARRPEQRGPGTGPCSAVDGLALSPGAWARELQLRSADTGLHTPGSLARQGSDGRVRMR
ncbi:uncharacterized protein [Tursiops truncatus]|uniref:uncharacterized protein isoform X1 n=1 Tax=Tursiops truncatus TaxID=9739 RepID=UPI003CCFBC0D